MRHIVFLLPFLVLVLSGCGGNDSTLSLPTLSLPALTAEEQIIEATPVQDSGEAAAQINTAAVDVFKNERRFARSMSGMWQGDLTLGREIYTTNVILTDAGWSDITAFSTSGASIISSITDVVMLTDQSYSGSIIAAETDLRIYGELGVDRWVVTILPADVDFDAYTTGAISLSTQQAENAGSWDLSLKTINLEAEFPIDVLTDAVTLANESLLLDGAGTITDNNFGFLFGNCEIIGSHTPDPKLAQIIAISVSLTGTDCDFEGSFPGIIQYDADAATVTTLISDTQFRTTAVQNL